MHCRIFLTLAFIAVQLFAYTSLCADNYYGNLHPDGAKIQAINNSHNGSINKTQTDAHFVCQNFSAKSALSQHKRADNNHIFACVLNFRLSERFALLKYIWNHSNYKTNTTHLVFSTEVNRRAP